MALEFIYFHPQDTAGSAFVSSFFHEWEVRV